jgi:long-chain acyl-CoA synthetase
MIRAMRQPVDARAAPGNTPVSPRPPVLRLLPVDARSEPPRHVDDLLRISAARWPDRLAMTRRRPGQPGPCTYAELDARVDALAAGLLGRGLRPGDRVVLAADNCRAWLEADQALSRAGLVSVPRGTDTTPRELETIAEHSGARAVIGEHDETLDALAGAARRLPFFVLERSSCGRPTLGELTTAGADALARGEGASLLREARAATPPDALFTLVYTSGTTGRPKGVMLSHANVLGNAIAAQRILVFRPGDRFLSILPSWHMFERVVEYVGMAQGGCIVYTSQRDLRHDLEHERPDCVAFVPRIWESLAAGLRARLDGLPGWRRQVLATFRELGESLQRGDATWAQRALHARLSRLLLRPFWKALGGRLRLGVSGGAALPEEVDRFLLSVGLPLLQGYGLTETSPVVSVRLPEANRLRSSGPPLPGTEVRVEGARGAAVGPGEPGEILVRGPQVMQGYYRDAELTASVLCDGWFRTGDLGTLDHDGWLYVTGRCKDTIVLLGGENVEPEPIEGSLRTSRFIAQVMLVGQDRKVLGALVVPNADALVETLGEVGRDPQDPAVRETLRGELDRLSGRTAGFRPVDRVGPFAVLGEAFATGNGCLTATLKLRRHVIAERWREVIARLYEAG